jgi:hypothetical protein
MRRLRLEINRPPRFDYLVICMYRPYNQFGLYAVMADTRTGRECPGRPSFDAAARRYVASFALSCTTARQMRVLARTGQPCSAAGRGTCVPAWVPPTGRSPGADGSP